MIKSPDNSHHGHYTGRKVHLNSAILSAKLHVFLSLQPESILGRMSKNEMDKLLFAGNQQFFVDFADDVVEPSNRNIKFF